MNISLIYEMKQQAFKISRELSIAIFGGMFIAIFSQIAFPLPLTPVPVTLQTLAIFLLAGFLGPRRATASVVSYLAQGCMGLPVFAGGVSDIFWFVDSKAGFLFSFIVAAFLIGKLIERRYNPPFIYILSALLFGQLAVSIIGSAWLSVYVGISNAIAFGIVPFLSGAMMKIMIAALILKARMIFFK